MHVAVVAREKGKKDELEKILKKRKHKISTNPELVVSCGGDGTLLISERMYPNVPKLIVKDSEICNSCPGYDTPLDELFAKIERGSYSFIEHTKLQAQWIRKGKVRGEYVCTNDFMIRNQLLFQALRFSIKIDDKEALAPKLIGDGVVIATPFGSNAYYKSITKTNISEGIGIALNNCTIKERGITTSKDKTVTIEILRMPADFAVDNDPAIETLEPGDTIVINASAQKMKIISL